MRVLILGGSWFVGRVVVEEAARRGHDVTVFNRGVTPAVLPVGVRRIAGDREAEEDIAHLARQGPWDVLIDVSGSVPAVVQRSAAALADVADRCVFVSTISVYRDWPHAPVDERSPLWDGDPSFDPGTRRWDPDAYGPLKVGCEMAYQQTFGEQRLLVLRPHVVLGRYEYVGRLPWWLTRVQRGGRVLVPAPDRGVQPVDVRDLSDFLLDMTERTQTGTFNVAAPPLVSTFGDLIRACIEAVAGDRVRPAELVWVDEDWLAGQDVAQWTELPLWRNAAAPWGMNVDRSLAAGLRSSSLRQTAADTWEWLNEGGRAVKHERFAQHGIAPDKESTIIARWLTRR